MLTSALVIMTILPLQINPGSKLAHVLDRPLMVAAVVDCARILGLPKLKLRDSNSSRYQAEKIIMQEPLAILQTSSDQMAFNQTGLRKVYIQSYVLR